MPREVICLIVFPGYEVQVLDRSQVPEKPDGWDDDYENEKPSSGSGPSPEPTPEPTPDEDSGVDGLGELKFYSTTIATIKKKPTMAKGQSDIFYIDKTGRDDFHRIDWYVYDLEDEKLIDIGSKVIIDRPTESPTKIVIFPVGVYLIYGYAYAKGSDVPHRIPGYEVQVLDRSEVPEKPDGWDDNY